MAKLIYSAIMSLDGYIADEHGNFDWAEPDEELHAFINNLEWLVGRRCGHHVSQIKHLATVGTQ
jgi:dihydrofolate reductase